MNEKELFETRNNKVSEMESILNLAKEEKRAISEEENAKFEALDKEVQDIDNTISKNERLNKIGGMKEVKEVEALVANVEDKIATYNKEYKQFDNVIRGIINEDTPTMPSDMNEIIPTTIWDRIIDQVIEICPIFESADRYVLGGKLVLPKYDREHSSITMSYATEGTTADSGKVVLDQVELNGFLGRCLAKISNSLINNTKFDVVGFIEAKMAQAIALFIEGELLHGTNQKIEGLRGISEDMTIETEGAGVVSVDDLMDVQDAVVDKYQANAYWIMNKKTRSAIRKLKDREGQYLLNRDLNAKWGYTLLGKDVYCSDAMDNVQAGKTPVFYGDYTGLAVKISEAPNMQVLRERYAEEHMTGVLAFVELDAKVADTQKIAKLVVSSEISG